MTAKSKTPKRGTVALAKRPTNTLVLTEQPGKTQELQMAESLLGSAATNALIAQRFASGGGEQSSVVGITEAVQVMNAASAAVNANDMTGMEAMLTAQAIALNVMFTELARRASLNLGTHLDATETYIRLSLKAQSQSRATIEALGALKNPPVIYAKQANFAAGHQQVNNAQAGIESSQIKQLEQQHVERMDGGAQSQTVGADPDLATVGAINGAAQRGREAAGKPERLSGREAACSAPDESNPSASARQTPRPDRRVK